jgi:hypothetical protein
VLSPSGTYDRILVVVMTTAVLSWGVLPDERKGLVKTDFATDGRSVNRSVSQSVSQSVVALNPSGTHH